MLCPRSTPAARSPASVKISLLVCRGDGASNHRVGKIALRAYGQTLHGLDAAHFADAAKEFVHRFKVGDA